MGREVCIVGFASLSREWVEDMAEHVEIWAMNEAHTFLGPWTHRTGRKATRWYQLHPKRWRAVPIGQRAYITLAHCQTCEWAETGTANRQAEVQNVREMAQRHADKHPDHDVRFGNVRVRKSGYGRPPHHLRWLKQCGIPVYQMKVDSRIPTSLRYPYREIVDRYGKSWVDGKKRPYLTSSAAFMLAHALYEHENGDEISKIYLAGIELALGTEYFDQRPCVEHWIGRLESAGVEWVPSPYGQSIMQGPIYAVEHSSPLNPGSMGVPVGIAAGVTSETVSVKEDHEGNPVGL